MKLKFGMQWTRVLVLACALLVCAVDAVSEIEQLRHELNQAVSEIGRVSSALAMIEGRTDAARTELLREVGALDRDVSTHSKDIRAVKTVMNTLVEDNVKMQGNLRAMHGMDTDLGYVRASVERLKGEMAERLEMSGARLNTLEGKLDKQADSQQRITVMMSGQMQKNKETLEGLKSKLTEETEGMRDYFESKFGGLQRKVEDLQSRLD
ncbi:uncharacterized protein LOC128226419 [Mya arenaria]|uniref:uncharacterized protein LOC128226419 n=1 Tax=Mya arenaria TaxID=6604 RepID=UPI0022E02D2D|nr:uncharacterized protein LOC128226419 [Mya arenaria]